MNDFENQVLADLAVLKAQMQDLVGNGQPGRIRTLELRVEELATMVQRGKAIALVVVPLIALFHLALHLSGAH